MIAHDTDPAVVIDGIDYSDDAIHVHVEGTEPPRTYCGVKVRLADHIPSPEVTEAAWCPTCVRLQDGAP